MTETANEVRTSIKEQRDTKLPQREFASANNSNSVSLTLHEKEPEKETTVDQGVPNDPTLTVNEGGEKPQKLPPKIDGLMDDPDFGHFDDDDFKIQDGDIIEYLMKEVILDFSARQLNRLAAIPGIVTYELVTGGIKSIGKTRDNFKEAAKDEWYDFKKYVRNKFKRKNNSNNNGSGNSHAADTHSQSGQSIDAFLKEKLANNADLRKNIDKLDKNSQKLLTSLYAGIYYFDDETKQVTNIAKSKSLSYEDFAKRFKVDIKDAKNLREQGKEYTLKKMKENLGISDTAHDGELKQYCEECLKPQTYRNEDIISRHSEEWEDAFASAFDANKKYSSEHLLEHKLKLSDIDSKTSLIACNYALYKSMEVLRKENVSDLSNIPEGTLNEMNESWGKTFAVAKRDVLKAMKSDKSLDLNNLIQISEEMCNKSLELAQDNDTKTEVKDEFHEKLTPKEKDKEPKTMGDEAKTHDYATNLHLSKQEKLKLKLVELSEKRERGKGKGNGNGNGNGKFNTKYPKHKGGHNR